MLWKVFTTSGWYSTFQVNLHANRYSVEKHLIGSHLHDDISVYHILYVFSLPHLSLIANSVPAPVVSPLPFHLCSTPLDSEHIIKCLWLRL